jgi:hypothetical protein
MLKLNVDVPTFEDWQAMAAEVVAEASRQPFGHWHGEYVRWLSAGCWMLRARKLELRRGRAEPLS